MNEQNDRRSTKPLVFLLGLVITANAWADEASAKRIASFVTTSWSTSDEVVAQTPQRFNELATLTSDQRAFYANALVATFQRRYDDAAKAVDLAIDSEENDLESQRLKIWLALLTKKYPVAIGAAKKLGEALVAKEELSEDQGVEMARFLGAAFGFLSGPVSDSVPAASKEAVEKKLLEELPPALQEQFRNARQDVLEKFTSLTTEKVESREKAIDEDEKDKEKLLSDVATRRSQLADQTDALQKRRGQVQEELREQLAEIAKADQPLQSEQARFESQAIGVRAELDTIIIDLSRLRDQLLTERDENRRRDLRFRIDSLRPLVARVEGNLIAIERQIAGVQSRRGELAVRQGRAQRDLGGQITSIDRQLNGMPGEYKKLDNIEKRSKKPATGSTGKVRALGVTAKSLNTYEPFPLELEKERLLAELKAAP